MHNRVGEQFPQRMSASPYNLIAIIKSNLDDYFQSRSNKKKKSSRKSGFHTTSRKSLSTMLNHYKRQSCSLTQQLLNQKFRPNHLFWAILSTQMILNQTRRQLSTVTFSATKNQTSAWFGSNTSCLLRGRTTDGKKWRNLAEFVKNATQMVIFNSLHNKLLGRKTIML